MIFSESRAEAPLYSRIYEFIFMVITTVLLAATHDGSFYLKGTRKPRFDPTAYVTEKRRQLASRARSSPGGYLSGEVIYYLSHVII